MGNYVIGVGKSRIVSPSEVGNYKIADTEDGPALDPLLREVGDRVDLRLRWGRRPL
jgi:hypothetical protein